MATETVTVTIEAAGSSDELDVPTALIDALSEAGEAAPTVVGDIAMLGLAQQAHGLVHHSSGDIDPDLDAAESLVMEHFESRFGRSFGEVTGHAH